MSKSFITSVKKAFGFPSEVEIERFDHLIDQDTDDDDVLLDDDIPADISTEITQIDTTQCDTPESAVEGSVDATPQIHIDENVKPCEGADAAELRRVRQQCVQLQRQADDAESARLSFQRQIRALNQRVLNLTEENAKLASENKSLLLQLDAADLSVASNPAPRPIAEVEQEHRVTDREMQLMEEKIDQLTQKHESYKATIQQLKLKNRQAQDASEVLHARIASLESTIEANLYAHASHEAELRQEIDALTRQLDEARSQQRPLPQQRGKCGRKSVSGKTDAVAGLGPDSRFTAVDQLMNATDWFVPAEPTPPQKDPEVEQQFGYKEPQRKTSVASADDDKQLTLF